MRNQPEFFQITVSGKGQFPLDMLRYDLAYPVCARDVEWIGRVKTSAGSGSCVSRKYQVAREVNLICRTLHGPTVARWESFGWKVISNTAHYTDGRTVQRIKKPAKPAKPADLITAKELEDLLIERKASLEAQVKKDRESSRPGEVFRRETQMSELDTILWVIKGRT